MEKHIGGNLYVYNDDVEIIDYLVDNNLMPRPINKAFSVVFQPGKDLDLILFTPNDTENKFLHFKFYDFVSNTETLVYLISMFSNLAKENYEVYKPAQKRLEEYLYMLPTYRALFGYKYNEDNELYQKMN